MFSTKIFFLFHPVNVWKITRIKAILRLWDIDSKESKNRNNIVSLNSKDAEITNHTGFESDSSMIEFYTGMTNVLNKIFNNILE